MDTKIADHDVKLAVIEHDISEIKKDVREVLDIIRPNHVQTALNKQSIGRLWWFVGSIALVVAGKIIYLFCK